MRASSRPRPTSTSATSASCSAASATESASGAHGLEVRCAAMDLADFLTVADFHREARKRLTKTAYDYYRSGADRGRTRRDNRRAFDAWCIAHRVLVDVSASDPAITLLGVRRPHPILVAPTAYHRLAHPQ